MWLLDYLFPVRDDESVVRIISDETLNTLMKPTMVPQEAFPITALLPFHETDIRALIHEAKYHGSDKAFAHLAAVLSEHLRGELSENFGLLKPVLVPVPLGRERLKERGFNQVAEVVKRAATELEIATRDELLIRTRDTKTQISLSRAERVENMRGAFAASTPVSPAYLYIVVDDVTTTGATLAAACAALREAGAMHLMPLALAH